jgi:hypothetical protein
MKTRRATPPRWSSGRGFISLSHSRLLRCFLLAFFSLLLLSFTKNKMRFSSTDLHLTATALIPSSWAQTSAGPAPGPDGKYVVTGMNIRATFIPYGASISNLFINDTSGVERDIVGGWDNATYYGIDKQHPHFGGIPVSTLLFQDEGDWRRGLSGKR